VVNVEQALAYAQKHTLHALVAQSSGRITLEAYGGDYDLQTPHPLYSGTKSFWGVAAACAQADGILDLDEPVAATFEQWSDPVRKRVTLRMLLQLTSGIGFGGLGRAVPSYERALQTQLKNPAGSTFTYGGIPLQVFGAVFARKLAPRKQSPYDYLRARILDPIGLRVGSWRELPDGTQTLPTGAMLTAREWLKYGTLVAGGGVHDGKQLVPADALAQCLRGSSVNPSYGLGWWLGAKGASNDLAYASGSAGQALYIVPSLNIAVVHFGKSSSYRHDAFLRKLFS
jgi:CubicO group peptidase (beta-lactamase class C family)